MQTCVVAPSSQPNLAGETQWLEKSTIKQLNITKTPPNPTAPRPSIMRKATTPRAKSTQQTPSNIPKMLANIANRLTLRANSKNKSRGPMQIGPFSFPEQPQYGTLSPTQVSTEG